MRSAHYDFAALVGAWRDARQWANAHPELAKHYNARYRAFAAAFEAELDDCPKIAPPLPDWLAKHIAESNRDVPRDDHWHREIHRFALETEDRYRHLADPFAGYLEIPAEMLAVRDRFSPPIAKPLASARDAITAMVLELLVVLYPHAAERVISADELRHHGFDPAVPGPDPDDYW